MSGVAVSAVRPATAAEAAAALAGAACEGRAIVAAGGETSVGACGAPARIDTTLEMGAMAGIVAFEPDDLTLVARAGTSLAEIRAVIAARRLRLPGAPNDEGTIGGLLACGWSEPGAVAMHGRLRDRVLGMETASPDGKVTRSGGRVVKNVTGLDLHRLHVGACGAFGVITEVCVRLEPEAESTKAIAVEADSLEAAGAAWRWVRAEGPDPSALAVRATEIGARIVAVFEGDGEPVEAMAASVAAGWARHGRVRDAGADSPEVRDALAGPLAAPREGLMLTISERPSRVVDRLVWIHANAPGCELDAIEYPLLGSIHVAASGPRDALGTFWEAVARATREGTHFRIEQVPSGLRRATPAWSADPTALRLIARLKREFDPAGVLRPGSWSAEALESAAQYFEALR